MTAVFRDRLWLMGGWFNGRLPDASGSNEVWSSEDGANWKQETKAAGWSPRLGAGIVVFNDKLWILGGNEQYYYRRRKDAEERRLEFARWRDLDAGHRRRALGSARVSSGRRA